MLSGYIDCSVVPLLWAGGTNVMAGRSGLQSLLLSHTKPVTAQVSHFGGEQTHMLGIVDAPPGS